MLCSWDVQRMAFVAVVRSSPPTNVTRCQMWVEFVIRFAFAPRVFLLGTPVFLLSKKPTERAMNHLYLEGPLTSTSTLIFFFSPSRKQHFSDSEGKGQFHLKINEKTALFHRNEYKTVQCLQQPCVPFLQLSYLDV